MPNTTLRDAARSYFDRELPRLLREHKGRWAVVRGEELLGIVDDLDDAYDVVYDHGLPEECWVERVRDASNDPPAVAPSLMVWPT